MEDKNTAKKSETYYPDGGYGWVIVGAIILINVSLQTLVPCFGLIFSDEFSKWGITSAQTSFLLHLQSSLYCTCGFFSSPLLKKYGMRATALTGATLMCSGIFLSSFATSYIYLIFSISVLIGLGQGILMPATYLATYTYFKKRLTIAISLTVTSASLSSIVMPKMFHILLSKIGREHTILILSFMSLFSFVGCFLLKPVKKQSDDLEENGRYLKEVKITAPSDNKKEDATEELLSQNVKSNKLVNDETTAPAKCSTIWSKLFDMFDLHLLKDIPFVLIVIGLGVSFASELNIIVMMQFILRDLCLFERSDVATAVSVQSVADILGRLVIPMLGHFCNAPKKVMYAGALVAASVGRTVLALWPTESILVFMVIALTGLTKGTRAVFQSVIIPQYVSLDKIPAANGINMLFTGSVSLVIGPLIGVVHDQSGSYVNTLYVASALSLACVVLWIFESTFLKKRTAEKEEK